MQNASANCVSSKEASSVVTKRATNDTKTCLHLVVLVEYMGIRIRSGYK